jgi:hypothetical protein
MTLGAFVIVHDRLTHNYGNALCPPDDAITASIACVLPLSQRVAST